MRALIVVVAVLASCSRPEPARARQAVIAWAPAMPPRPPEPDPGPPLLSSFSTWFSPVDGRTRNIRLAAAGIDGHVIGPGATMSFNEVVGIRSAAAGYREAPVLLEGRRVDDVGGGVCQVSSTLHAAAVTGRMTVRERYPHSLVPRYVHAGYDATVAFPASCEEPGQPCGKLDLRIENPYPVPIMVRAGVDESDNGQMRLTVWLEGASTDCRPEVSYWGKPLDRGVRRMVRSPKVLDADYVKVVQQAAAGAVVWSSIVWKCPGRPDEAVRWYSRYPPVDEVWEVGWRRPRDAPPPWERDGGAGGP